ncbi:hypothetical protein Sango_1597000 [Sesamum angolense]|uniref:Transposase MuDR plant domain-containing protein n=1 Tax=Sesamum angolense TaxID=2727404 RepID=A0AAE2BQT5_9LAMI|nr:hypothetical protein Sango_1597000 [Sesamum angolense]
MLLVQEEFENIQNDKRRVYVKCLGDGCQWIMHALKLGEERTFQIRQYNPEHKCARSFNVKNLNSKWLSTKYEDAFRTDPKRNVKGFRKDVIKELRCHVSRNQAYRAKKKALEAIEGKAEDQFDSLWDYASELRNSNPGSTVMMVMTDGDYGVDGCHLKGPYGGVLLTVVSIDPNNNLYPLAYAVVSGVVLRIVKGKWDLTGIPCNHGMSAICSQSLEPDDFVNPCYSVATFIEVYKHAILPVNGPKLWEKTGFVRPLPPNFGKGAGRPARARRMEHDEPQNKGKKRIRGQKN